MTRVCKKVQFFQCSPPDYESGRQNTVDDATRAGDQACVKQTMAAVSDCRRTQEPRRGLLLLAHVNCGCKTARSRGSDSLLMKSTGGLWFSNGEAAHFSNELISLD